MISASHHVERLLAQATEIARTYPTDEQAKGLSYARSIGALEALEATGQLDASQRSAALTALEQILLSNTTRRVVVTGSDEVTATSTDGGPELRDT